MAVKSITSRRAPPASCTIPPLAARNWPGLHVVPPGFVRIRHYGLLGNRVRAENLARCRVLLGRGQGTTAGGAGPPEAKKDGAGSAAETRCPACGQGQMVRVGKIDPATPDATDGEVLPVVAAADTS